jgi:predicted signal transduction protein with EAL and GGDEF domain
MVKGTRADPGSPEDHGPDTSVRVRREVAAVSVGGTWQRVFARLTEASSDAFAVLTSQWRFRLLGGDVAGVLGCSVEELRTRPLLDRVHPADRQRVARGVAEAQASPGTQHTLDFRWQSRAGLSDVRALVIHVPDEPAIDGLVMTLRRPPEGNAPEVMAHQVADRAAFVAALVRAGEKSAQGYAVLVITVADLPHLAAGLGSEQAHRLVQVVGKRIRGAVHQGDMVAQVGIGSFAVLLGGVQDEPRIRAVAERLRDRLRTPFRVAGQELVLGASIGFATRNQGTSDDEGVLAAAEAAAVRSTSTRPRAFHTPMREDVRRRMTLAAALPRAFQRNELQIRYQPIIRIADGSVSGFEALVRWMHPDIGSVSPGEFIPLAEQLDWIVKLDRWMLEEACRRVASWGAEVPFRISVNVSARHLDDPSLVSTVASALGASGLDPARLRIEVTETAVARDPQRSLQALARLKAVGVSLAIDDFGTGYASLASLADMPLDVLKVDMSFVRRLHETQSRGVVHNLVAMAHDLGLEVVAEGVESAEQLAHLREMGCDCAQGYLFAAPLPSRQARGWLTRPPQ